MMHSNKYSSKGPLAALMMTPLTLLFVVMMAAAAILPTPIEAFVTPNPSIKPVVVATTTSPTALSMGAMNKRNKFNKQKDLAAKMAEAKRLRELAEEGGGGGAAEDATAENASATTTTQQQQPQTTKELTAEEIKLRNDQKRFADLLENSLTSGNDMEKGYYLTVAQEDESAEAVFRGVVRLYEGDPAPTSPFAELLSIENGEAIGKGGAKRLLPWEGSKSAASDDYLVVITDPRPKSVELRTAMKRLVGSLSPDTLRKCCVINTDTPAENRRFAKKNLEENKGLNIYCDENMEWMREYTALGEKRFSMTMFILRGGKVERIAREVEAEVLTMVVKNAIRSLS